MSSPDFATIERVDVHAHAVTPRYREFLIQTGHQNPDGWPEIPVGSPTVILRRANLIDAV